MINSIAWLLGNALAIFVGLSKESLLLRWKKSCCDEDPHSIFLFDHPHHSLSHILVSLSHQAISFENIRNEKVFKMVFAIMGEICLKIFY